MTENGHTQSQGSGLDATNPISMQELSGTASFESAWPQLSSRVHAMLLGRGIAPDVADDVVQEAGIKLFGAWDRADPKRPLWPFVKTIAMNCLCDRLRREQVFPVGDIPDQPTNYDLEDHVLARTRLRFVGSAISGLRESDRELLLKEVTVPAKGATSRIKMARMRARRKLERALQDVAGAFGAVELAVKRVLSADLQRVLPDIQPAAQAAIGLVAIIGVATPSIAHIPGVPHHQIRSAHVRLMAALEGASHESKVEVNRHQPSAHRPGAASHQVDSGRVPQIARPPSPSPSANQRTVASAGGTSAKTKEGQGYKSAGVCVEHGSPGGEQSVSVAVDDGNQQEGDNEDPCS